MQKIMDKQILEAEQLHAEIANIIADTVRLKSVPEKIAAEVDAMREENKLRWIKHEANMIRYAEEREIERQRYAEERKAAEAKQAEERQRYAEERKAAEAKQAEESKRHDEERKARMARQDVEIKKMNREIFWYPIAMLGGASILTAVITVLLTKALLH